MTSSLVLLSGGLDSTTLLAAEVERAHLLGSRLEAVFVDYGQRHIREAKAAVTVAQHYAVRLHELDLRGYGALVNSALTSEWITVPHGHYSADTMAATVVPGRNATFLAAAAGLAASRTLGRLAVAVHAGDHPVYPDCRPDFVEAMGKALWLGYSVRVAAPFVGITKADIAAKAAQLRAPIAKTWSCYEGGELHCGRCGTCVERQEAFSLSGTPDPTEYADPEYWKQAVQ